MSEVRQQHLGQRLTQLCACFGAAARDFFINERRCPSCGGIFVATGASPFCPSCQSALLRRTEGYCPACGEIAAWAKLPAALCGRCLASSPPWQKFIFYSCHEGLLRRLLLTFKFQGELSLGRALGTLLAAHPAFSDKEGYGNADCIVPVPLSRKRLAARGFNQSVELARPLAKKLGLPLLPAALMRVRHTSVQSATKLCERAANVQGAFQAQASVAGKRVLLLDDVVTTTSTMQEAALALTRAGAESITAVAVARTPFGRKRL